LYSTSENLGLEEERELLTRGVSSLGLAITEKQIDAFFTYFNLLKSWNSRFNLTSIENPKLIIRHHFIDSIAVAPFIDPNGGRMMDIGSGAGFPGIPIKILFPEKELHLVEAQRKKINFLKEVTRKLNIKGLEVTETRAEKINLTQSGQYNEVITRASGPLQNFLRISAPLLLPGGKSLVMGGPTGLQGFRNEETRKSYLDLGFIESRLENYILPIGNEKRTLLIYTKG